MFRLPESRLIRSRDGDNVKIRRLPNMRDSPCECQGLYYKGSLAEAIAACERATGLGVSGSITSMLLAAFYLKANEPAKAAAARDRALKEFPELRLSSFFKDLTDGPLAQPIAKWSDNLRSRRG